jgi:hypothetical protein
MKTMQKRTFLTTAAAAVAGAATALAASSAMAADKQENTAEGLLRRLVKIQTSLEKVQAQIDEIKIPCSGIPCSAIPCDLKPQFLEVLKSIKTVALDIVETADDFSERV